MIFILFLDSITSGGCCFKWSALQIPDIYHFHFIQIMNDLLIVRLCTICDSSSFNSYDVWRWPLLGQILLMLTIQSFICSEAKGQLEGHEVSLNNRFLEVICVFPFGDLVEEKKKNKTEANLNSITFWMISIWGAQKTPTSQIQRRSQKIAKDCAVLLAKEKQQADVLAERSPFWETIPGHSMSETGRELVQNIDEKAWFLPHIFGQIPA